MTILPTFQVEVGILLCRSFREYLEEEKWKGVDVRYREGKGLLYRNFLIAAKKEDLDRIKNDIYKWLGND